MEILCKHDARQQTQSKPWWVRPHKLTNLLLLKKNDAPSDPVIYYYLTISTIYGPALSNDVPTTRNGNTKCS